MKNSYKVLGLMLVLALIAIPAYAAMETSGSEVVAPVKTLADFQKEWSGSKPITPILKYYDWKTMLELAPKPTLAVSRMRTEGVTLDEKTLANLNRGTKPVIGYIQAEEKKGERLEIIRFSFDETSGTKPAVQQLKK